MFIGGNWLLPTLNGELYLTKPPFYYWMSLVISSFVGYVNEWTLRLPSALAAIVTLWATYQYTFKKFGAWPALFSAQILIANAGYAMLARRAEIEMLLAALCAGAMLSALQSLESQQKQRWINLSYFLLALAVLSKGPVAMLFVTLPLVVAAIWARDYKIKGVLTNLIGWGIFLVVSLSWYLAVSLQLGFDIWAIIARRDMLEKIQAAEVAKPFLSYLGWITVDFLLLIALLFIKPKKLIQANAERLEWKVIITAVLIPLIIFSLFSNKHAKYLLPVYPFIAIVLGVQLGLIFDQAGARIKNVILMFGVLLPSIFVFFYMFAEARVFDYRTSAFPKFKVWSDAHLKAHLYAVGDIDSRLVYYSDIPITMLGKDEVVAMKNVKKSFLLLAEADGIRQVSALSDCTVEEFKPYLKRHKVLTVLGFGEACDAKNN